MGDDDVEESRPLVDPLQGGDSTFAASDTAADDFFGSATVAPGGENGQGVSRAGQHAEAVQQASASSR